MLDPVVSMNQGSGNMYPSLVSFSRFTCMLVCGRSTPRSALRLKLIVSVTLYTPNLDIVIGFGTTGTEDASDRLLLGQLHDLGDDS